MKPNLAAVAALTVSSLLLISASAPTGAAPGLTEEQKALHALNRLGFGPRPGDVEKVMAMGVDRWIDQQLHPERIRDTTVEQQLAGLRVLRMSNSEIFDTFGKPMLEARELKRKGGKGNDASDTEQADALKKLRESIPPESRPQRIVEELSAAKMIRAVGSERQLDEVMTDFWLNHFNVNATKGADRLLIATYERDVIRPHMWGKFEDLLLATATSPAMLFYLDNARSVAEPANRPSAAAPLYVYGNGRDRFGGGMRRVADKPRNKGGLNENYARELMELHTLGVDGGYTQKDVTELARVLTGWSITTPKEGAFEFRFRREMHDVKPKTVLGYNFPAGGGIDEGERMLYILAHQPATARHIATELCQRLVADEPPQTLVDRVARRFLDTGGDLRETVRAVVTSPEFFDPGYYRAKVKTPFEYTASAIRAVGGTTDGRIAAKQVENMGEPLYRCQPPTGYSDAAKDWVTSGALVARMNFALALASGKVPGTTAEHARAVASNEADPVGAAASAIAGVELSEPTRKAISDRLAADGQGEQASLVTALVLGSPEFQRQ